MSLREEVTNLVNRHTWDVSELFDIIDKYEDKTPAVSEETIYTNLENNDPDPLKCKYLDTNGYGHSPACQASEDPCPGWPKSLGGNQEEG